MERECVKEVQSAIAAANEAITRGEEYIARKEAEVDDMEKKFYDTIEKVEAEREAFLERCQRDLDRLPPEEE